MAATLRRVPSKSAFKSLRTVYGCSPIGKPSGLAPARPPLKNTPARADFRNSLRLIVLMIFPILSSHVPGLSIFFRQITIGFLVTYETLLLAIPGQLAADFLRNHAKKRRDGGPVHGLNIRMRF